jgi:hypothetical protein
MTAVYNLDDAIGFIENLLSEKDDEVNSLVDDIDVLNARVEELEEEVEGLSDLAT